MRKYLIYLVLVFCLFSALSLPNLLNSHQGFVFIIEEIAGAIFLLLGFLLLSPLVKRIIQRLNKSHPWSENLGRRILTEIGILSALTIFLAVTTIASGWLFFELYGAPDFFETKELLKLEEVRKFPNRSLNHRFSVKEFSFFFYSFAIIAGCFFLFLVMFLLEENITYNKHKQEKRIKDEQVEKEIAYSKVSVLQNQLNPHFMFNTLNVLSGLIHEDVDKADIFIKKLSEIYRYVLVQSGEVVSSLEKELDFLRAYIYLLKIRFDDKLRVNYDIDNSKLHWFLPSMTLELLIENAIKHNSLDSKNPLIIDVIVQDDDLLVKNNILPRIDRVASNGIGIKNLQERLIALDIHDASFGIKDNIFIARIPFINPQL